MHRRNFKLAVTAVSAIALAAACSDRSDPVAPRPADRPARPAAAVLPGGPTFTDGDFAPADWELVPITNGAGGTITAERIATGGQPGAYRHVKIVENGSFAQSQVGSAQFLVGAVWDPAGTGAIASVDFRLDAILLQCFSGCDGPALLPAIRQDGNVYAYFTTIPTIGFGNGFWQTWKEISVEGMTPSDFLVVADAAAPNLRIDDATRQPDFSTAGSPLEFGFYENSTHAFNPAPVTIRFGFDNVEITVHSDQLTVAIDVKPGSADNPVSSRQRNGQIPVAILSTSADAGEGVTFDATTVDASTVRFGPGEASESHGRGHPEDVDGDGDLDMVLHFTVEASGLACGMTEVGLTGATTEGTSFRGQDAVRMIGC